MKGKLLFLGTALLVTLAFRWTGLPSWVSIMIGLLLTQILFVLVVTWFDLQSGKARIW